MKRFNILLLLSAVTIIYTGLSCRKILEQPDGSIITVDSVFNNPDNAMRALYTTYATCVVNGFITGDGGSGLSDAACFDGLLLAACDEGDQYGTGGRANAFNAGTWGSSNQDEFAIGRVTQGIRNACIFLDNVDKVPFINTGATNWTPQLKAQTEAEAKMLRAMMHYQMMIRYGGIPIINKTPEVVIVDKDGINTATVTPSSYRQSLKRVVQFIVNQCDEAAVNLPDAYPSSELGRVTKGGALALKAATLLYAASPLVNTATPVVSNGADSLLCMGNADVNRWTEAAAASKAVIDWATANGYALLDDATLGKSESYNYATGAVLDPRNKEVIWFDHSHGQQAGGANMVRWTCPIYFAWGNVAHGMPINFVKYYRNTAGTDVTIPTDGTYPQLKAILKNMEPRFHATAWWPGSLYTNTGLMNAFGGADTAKFLYKQGGINGNFVQTGAGTALIGMGVPNGFHVKKFTNLVNASNGTLNAYWPIFRLTEFYLNYAEALNEVNPADPNIFTSLNVIRRRGGLPDLAAGNVTYNDIAGNQEKIRQYVRRERGIELYGEERRFFDVRRWKIAGNDGVMKGEFQKIYLYENGTGSYVPPTTAMTPAQRLANDNKLSYKIERFENRVWEDKMYFYPFPQTEVNKGFLMQNPGW
jgi:starch-binding outer membrane protein, SusD/RagB family